MLNPVPTTYLVSEAHQPVVADVGGVAGADGKQVLSHVQRIRVLAVACGEETLDG